MEPDLLITFLGRVPLNDGSYRRTTYEFTDGTTSDPTAFFGWVLQRRLTPRKMFVLGTAGSMWDHLFEGDLDLGVDGEEHRMALMERVGSQQVDQALLDRLSPLLARHLGCEVTLVLIPYCRDDAEQIELLRLMTEQVNDDEHVHMDVTHGFRHLPMLALLSALHLRIARHAHIDGIWYGSFNPDTKRAPVYDLTGLLQIADWLQALSSFDKDGDYGVFSALLQHDGLQPDKAQALERASYAESTLNFGQARERLHTVLKDIDRLSGVGELYAPFLRSRMDWIRGQDDAQRLARLTFQALNNGDLLRAAILLPRAFLERLKRPDERTTDYAELDKIEKEFRAGSRGFHEHQVAYERAKRLRNALAHGSRPKGEYIRRNLASAERLGDALQTLTKELLGTP